MVSFIVRLRFADGKREAITELLRKLTNESRQEPGCVHYIAHFVEADPATVLIYEQYADEAALEHHRKTPHFLEYARDGLYRLDHTREVENLDAVA